MAESLEKLAESIWNIVCLNIDDILKECDLYGLAGILVVPDPSVEARILAIKQFEEVCTAIVSALERGHDQYSTIRVMLNAKQQILILEQLLNAAKNGDAKEFNEAHSQLKKQAKH